MIFFTHIQKTSGTSINNLVRDQVNQTLWCGHENGGKPPTFITGHFPYGLGEIWGITKNIHYVTFIRNPIERWKSSFYHLLRKRRSFYMKLFCEHSGLEQDLAHDCSNLKIEHIHKFLLWCINLNINKNIMCKQLSGMELMYNTRKWPTEDNCSLDFGYTQMFEWSSRYKSYTNNYMKEMKDVALDNLKTKYSFVGITENSNEDQLKFCRIFNFKNTDNIPYYNLQNPKSSVDVLFNNKNIIELLIELNKYDIELYEDYTYYLGT